MKDIEILKFKDELESLCKKYNCNISGRIGDDGSMNLSFPNQDYIMDCFGNTVYYFDDNENLKYPIDEVIRGLFRGEGSKLSGLNNIKVHCGIFTNDSLKAEAKLRKIMSELNEGELDRFVLSSNQKELILKNGERYIWIKPIDSSRGYRCKKAIIDRKIAYEDLISYVRFVCMYCGKGDIEIF